MAKKILLLLVVLFISASMIAQPTKTIADGNWHDVSIWDNGVPTKTLNAQVRHAVILNDKADAQNLNVVTPSGSLSYTQISLILIDTLP